MFSITGIHLYNFKSFRGEHDFEIPTEPGLYFLTGTNAREPKLGSNGAGKSTLLDAIYWCLYGHTLRGLKASDVVTWGERSCKVAVCLYVAGEEMLITRTQSPNSLTIDQRMGQSIVDQAGLEKYISLNAESFVYSVILPQFGQSFFELKPAEKLTLFSKIMNLDFWLEHSEKAATATKAISTDIDKTVMNIENYKQWIVNSNDATKNLTEKQKLFEDERKQALRVIALKADKLQSALDELTARKTKHVEDLATWERDKVRRSHEIERIYKARDHHNQHCSDLNHQRSTLLDKVQDFKSDLENLKGVGAKCPTCLQKVNEAHLKEEQTKLKSKIAQYNALFDEKDKQHKECVRFATKVTRDAAQYAAELETVINNCILTRNKLGVVGERFKGISESAAGLKDDYEQKENEANPYAELLATEKQRITGNQLKLEQAKNKLANLNAEHEATSFWVSGFKRIRLFVIEETLRALELEVNNVLSSLGLVDWQIEFDIERENKSGGVTKGFVVFIRCPSNPEPVRWESWSGGETQRLQLAGDFGLANLIMLQAGLVNDIEFFDEPSDHLSDEGLIDLAETLQQRAMDDNKRIFLVDHRMPDFGDFTGTITVVKDENGSRIKKAP